MPAKKLLTTSAIALTVGASFGMYALYTNDTDTTETAQVRLRPTPTAPPTILKRDKSQKKSKINGIGSISYQSEAPSAIDLASVPRIAQDSADTVDYVRGGSRADSKFSDEQAAAAVAAAQGQAQSDAVQNLDGSQKPVGFKPKGGVSFGAIDAVDCCTNSGFSATVPPDADMAAGPNHLIVVVNIAFEIYDKQGN